MMGSCCGGHGSGGRKGSPGWFFWLGGALLIIGLYYLLNRPV
jgi:hypothetical protein